MIIDKLCPILRKQGRNTANHQWQRESPLLVVVIFQSMVQVRAHWEIMDRMLLQEILCKMNNSRPHMNNSLAQKKELKK
jgi:hypothetical protein